MSRWTHAICRECYAHREPGREPARVSGGSIETCCFCGHATDQGIYYRADPAGLRCNGQHGDE